MEKIMIVDGYNVLYSIMKNPKDLEMERQKILRKAREYRNYKVIVVFDGSVELGGVKSEDCVFTRGYTADEYIKSFVKKHENPRNITVVTKDRGIKDYVKALGANVISPGDFLSGPENKHQRHGETLEKGVLKPEEVAKINRELLNLWENT